MKKIKNEVEEKAETYFAYRSVAEAIYKDFIENSKLIMGDSLPTEQVLMEHYKVSRTTIRRGVKELVKRGLVYTVQGSGTFIDGKKQEILRKGVGFSEQAELIGLVSFSKVLEFKVEEASEKIAEILNIKKGDPVYRYKRLRYLDNIPNHVETGFLPVELFPDLSIGVLSNSKYQYIEETKKMLIKNHYFVIKPILLDSYTAELLETKPNVPVDCIKATSFLEDDIVFEYTEIIRNSSKYDLSFNVDRQQHYI